MPDQTPPVHVLHGDDLAWLELALCGAVPRRYVAPEASSTLGPRLPVLLVPPDLAAAALTFGQLELVDPEGVPLAELTMTEVVEVDAGHCAVVGVPRALAGFGHHDHADLRAAPDAVASGWQPGPAVALWGDGYLTWTVRDTARRYARSVGHPLLEVVATPSGRDTDVVAHLPARLARLETTRDEGDRAIVVPDPGLGWRAPDVLTRARIVAEYGAATLLVPPGRLDELGAAAHDVHAAALEFGVTVHEVAAHLGETRLDGRVIDRLVLSDEPFPDWFAEDPVAAEFRRLHRPLQCGGFTVLLSGLSGSGKSTVARRLAVRLLEHDDRSVSLLDGDVVRHHLSQGLGFSRADRDTNVRRIGFVASEITKAGGIAIACPIAPYAATRADVRQMVQRHGPFVLVHVATPLAECERRDRKGLYAKARRGEIPEFTGISDPYEEPTDAEVTVDTTDISVDEATAIVLDYLRTSGLIPGDPSALQPPWPPFASPRVGMPTD